MKATARSFSWEVTSPADCEMDTSIPVYGVREVPAERCGRGHADGAARDQPAQHRGRDHDRLRRKRDPDSAPRQVTGGRAIAASCASAALALLCAAVPAAATYPGDNGRIFFSARSGCGVASVKVNATGYNCVDPFGRDPAISPDNRRIASVRGDQLVEVYGADINGKGTRRLTQCAGRAPEQPVAELLTGQPPDPVVQVRRRLRRGRPVPHGRRRQRAAPAHRRRRPGGRVLSERGADRLQAGWNRHRERGRQRVTRDRGRPELRDHEPAPATTSR